MNTFPNFAAFMVACNHFGYKVVRSESRHPRDLHEGKPVMAEVDEDTGAMTIYRQDGPDSFTAIGRVEQ